jgi:hypothetical protein
MTVKLIEKVFSNEKNLSTFYADVVEPVLASEAMGLGVKVNVFADTAWKSQM